MAHSCHLDIDKQDSDDTREPRERAKRSGGRRIERLKGCYAIYKILKARQEHHVLHKNQKQATDISDVRQYTIDYRQDYSHYVYRLDQSGCTLSIPRRTFVASNDDGGANPYLCGRR